MDESRERKEDTQFDFFCFPWLCLNLYFYLCAFSYVLHHFLILRLKDDRIFPPYFEFLHRYIAHIQRLSPDEIIQIVHQDLEKLMLKFVHNAPEPGIV
jgi:hypothetical protein